jgi:hypothetical protein
MEDKMSNDEYQTQGFWEVDKKKRLGWSGSPFLIYTTDLITIPDRKNYPMSGDLTMVNSQLCYVRKVNKDQTVEVSLVTSVANDCIELDEDETSLIRQLCSKYNLLEPDCNLQTLNNLILIENKELREKLTDITGLARSSNNGDITITAMILLKHDDEAKKETN